MANHFFRSTAFLFLSRKALLATAILIILMSLSFLAAWAVQRDTYPAYFQNKEKKPPLSTVYGRAVYHDTEQPARRLQVVLWNLNRWGPEDLSSITNSRGEFRIESVPAGRYFVGVEGRSVVSTRSFLNHEVDRESHFDFRGMSQYFEEVEVDGKSQKQVTVRVRRGGVITGKVSYANGEPAMDHPVAILRRKEDRYAMMSRVNSMVDVLLTDDRGIFRIAGLPEGDYVVGATPMIEHGELIKDLSLEANMVGSYLAMTFHPSTTLLTQATPVRVDTGEERGGIDITIPDQEMHKVAGTVRRRDDRRPVAGARIRISRKETYEKFGGTFWSNSMGMPGVETDEQGRWRLAQVPDGRYIVFVQALDQYGERPPGFRRYGATQQEVEVSGADVQNMLIEVGDEAVVSGTVTVDSGSLPRGIELALTTMGINGETVANATVLGGRFTIPNVPFGKMYFSVSLQEGVTNFYIKSITWKEKDLLREPLEVAMQTKIEGVQIVLSPQVASFTIRVQTPLSEPVSNVSLVLVPADSGRWARLEAHLDCTTDSNGRCQLTGAPGEYLVFVLPPGVEDTTFRKDEIQQRAAQARRVSLGPGERRTFEVVVFGR